MPALSDIKSLPTWRVRGRVWLNSGDRPKEHELLIATPSGANDAVSLAHAALASEAPAPPAKVEVDSLDATGEKVRIWDARVL